ncbi:hypothetical protein [Flavobacterium lindanitolerans]|uniref:hypothetical protein n=1 Tax=Flavobacterium lindanitolerans TaxID=428988 RepID=UPI0027B8C40F|nr:hypothetical protein [Flavobacterium lindanitolerans]
MPTQNHDPLFDRKGAAKYIGNFSAGTLAVWATKKKHLKFYKIGGKACYRKSDLDAFVASRLVK